MSTPDRPRVVNCPRCGTPTPWSAGNPYRPFCSERCKLVDLGQWATEAYRIPEADNQAQHDDDQPG